MNQKPTRPNLIIEWDREWTRVHFVDSAQTREGVSLGSIEGVGGKNAVVVLSRRLVMHRSMALPESARNDTLVVLKQKLGDVFPISVSELAFDFLPSTIRSTEGRLSDVFAAKTSDVREVLAVCDGLGITVQQIVPAQAYALRVAQEQALSSGIIAERFGDLVNLDGFKEGSLTVSKTVTLDRLDDEIARITAVAGPKILAQGVEFNGTEQRLGGNLVALAGTAAIPMDLEPDEYRREKLEKRRKVAHRQAYVLFAGGFCVAAMVGNELVLKQQDFAKQEKKEKNLTNLVKSGLDIESGKLSKVGPKAKQLKLAFMPPQRMSDVTKVATSLIPKGVWLTALNLERGKLLQLRGSAKNSEAVAEYIGALTKAGESTKQNRFRDVRLVFANAGEIEGEKVVQFNITAFPVGNLPVVEASKKKKK